MKKLVCLVMAVLLVAALLTACGNKPAESSATDVSSEAVSSSTPEKTPDPTPSPTPTPVDAPLIDLSSLLEGKSNNTDIPGWDAEGKVITASHSLEVGWAQGYGKGFLIDGVIGEGNFPADIGVFASCTLAEDNVNLLDINTKENVEEWIMINLQKPYMVSKFSFYTVLRSPKGAPKALSIEVSEDGETWTKVVDEEKYFTDDFNAEQPFTFEPVKAQYVRLNVTKIAQDYDPALKYSLMLSEIQVFGEEIA